MFGTEAGGQPGFQSDFLLNKLFEWVIEPGQTGQRHSIEQPRTVAQGGDAQQPAARHKNEQRNAVGPQYYGIEGSSIGGYGLVPQQQ